MKNIKKTVLLYYVIRKKPNPIPLANMTEEDEIIYHAPHTGAAFIADNKQVHTYLTELTNGTDADQWIKHHKRTQNGKQAWIDLCNHYDGAAEGSKRVAVSRSDIQILHYKNEASFPFEQYSTRLRKAFTTLEQYEQGKHEKEKVEILLDQINTNDPKLISTIAICRDSHSATFDDACTYMSEQISVLYPQLQPNAFGKTGRGARKPRTRRISSIKKRNGKTYFNGVDITDTTRYFSAKEFHKLGEEGRKYLSNDPKRKAYKDKNLSKTKKRKQQHNDEETNRQIAAIINGVMNASRVEASTSTQGSGISRLSSNNNHNHPPLPPMPQHGPHARPPSTVNQVQQQNSSNISQVTYDHNGNIV